ncbi:MAG: hypothetical protein JWQ07_5941 [Ramlibacter sp.]|nr:hypothetical protein [Ramlibacter sp.]
MPFDSAYEEVYREVYRPVCEANELHCWRVDEIARPGSITRDIVEGIIDAEVVIADLTGQNPNVFYELGIAHSVGNKTIMTAQKIEDVPFDIRSYRVLLYEQTITGSKRLGEDLNKALKELLAALDRTSNPVQEAVASRSPIGLKTKTPLVKYVDVINLPGRMREWLRENKIVYADDVANIDLRALAETPGIGQDSLGRFLRAVIRHDLYPDAEALNNIMLEYRISTRLDRKG